MEATPISTVVCVDVEPDRDLFVIETGKSARAEANTWDSFQASADFFESLRTTLPRSVLHKLDQPFFGLILRSDDCLHENATIRRNLESLIEEIRTSGRSPAITTPTEAREILGYN